MEAAEKKEVTALDELFQEVGTYRKSSDLNALYEFIRKFPRIAPFNALLLHIQKPGSRFVASAKEWKSEFNRTINPGSRPLVILWPFAPVRFVFELQDTSGDTFPSALLNPFETTGEINQKVFDRLIKNLPAYGVTYDEADHGTGSAGYINKYSPSEERYIGKKKVRVFYSLVVNANLSREAKLATIAHELGHLLCGHLGTPSVRLWPDRRRLTPNVEEFEAESVAWLVCERAGITNPSAKYLSGYLDNNECIPQISLENVLKTAGIVEAMMLRTIPPLKEVVIN